MGDRGLGRRSGGKGDIEARHSILVESAEARMNWREGQLNMDAEAAMHVLRGKLWHTTSEARFQGIREVGAILRCPPVAEEDRWGTAIGREGWPYVRTLGGVSLFDFADFDPEDYEARCPVSSWREFVPFRRSWGASVWIEIDRAQAAAELIGANDLVQRQKIESKLRHNLMPYIEACYLGDLPCDMLVRALVVEEGDEEFRPICL